MDRGSGECAIGTIVITNVLPSMKKELKDIAKEERTTLAPMIKRILRKALKNYKVTGDLSV